MKASSKILLGIALLLSLIVVGFFLLRAPDLPDHVQIATQLEAARAAGEQHDVSGIMRIVSEHYHDTNGLNPLQLRLLFNKVEGNGPVQVTQSLPIVTIQGDTATSTSHLRITTTLENHVVYDHDVTIQWAREEGIRLGVLPTKVWRVVSADYGSPFGE